MRNVNPCEPSSSIAGTRRHVDTKGLYSDNKYCDEKAIKKKDANGDMITVATDLYCSFPGW
jgi:hypothetical protein